MENEKLKAGYIGFIKSIDDMGQLHVLWQNGSNLALNLEVDKFKKVDIKKLPIERQFQIDELRQKLQDRICINVNSKNKKLEQYKNREEKINKRS